MEKERAHWSPLTKIVVSLLMLGLGLYLVYRFSAVLAPLVLAGILAYVLTPLAAAIQKRLGVRRTVAVFLAYLALLVALVLIPVVVIPPLSAQVAALNLDIQLLLREFQSLLESRIVVMGQTVDLGEITGQLPAFFGGSFEPVFGQTLGLLVEVISSLAWLVFILVVSFYLVKDSGRLGRWIESLVPTDYREDYRRLVDDINGIWAAFFRGQMVLAFVVASIITVAGLILGLPFALALGALAGLLELLPSVGHGIWLIIASPLALFLGSSWLPLPNWLFMLFVIGLHMVFQQFDLNYLIPRVIGRRVQLPPLVVILGIVFGAVLAGVLGILLAAPTIASARVLGRYVYANLFDLDPFPAPASSPLPPPDPQWWRRYVPRDPSDLRTKS